MTMIEMFCFFFPLKMMELLNNKFFNLRKCLFFLNWKKNLLLLHLNFCISGISLHIFCIRQRNFKLILSSLCLPELFCVRGNFLSRELKVSWQKFYDVFKFFIYNQHPWQWKQFCGCWTFCWANSHSLLFTWAVSNTITSFQSFRWGAEVY